MKLRIVPDTHVLISAIFFETGNEAKILNEVLKGKIILVSSHLLQELRKTTPIQTQALKKQIDASAHPPATHETIESGPC